MNVQLINTIKEVKILVCKKFCILKCRQIHLLLHHSKGSSMRKIVCVKNVSTIIAHRIIYQFEDENRIEAKTSTDRPLKLTERTTNLLEYQVKQNYKISGPKLEILHEGHYYVGGIGHELPIKKTISFCGQ